MHAIYNRVLAFVALTILITCNLHGQDSIASIKHKKCILKGKWQLVRTFSNGSLHDIAKNEYDGTIRFLPLHHYIEEVNYESYHWIIKGKWHVYKQTADLNFTERTYTLGKLEDAPTDIKLQLIQLSKTNWAAKGLAKGQPVELYYKRFSKK